MTRAKNTKTLISIPLNLIDELSHFSKELNRSKSDLVCEALEFYFEYLDLKVAKKRSLENSKTVSLNKIKDKAKIKIKIKSKLDKAYLRTIQNIKNGKYKIVDAKEHIKDLQKI